MTADEARGKIIECYRQFKGALDQYYDYASQVSALSVEFHKLRVAEVFKGLTPEEGVLVLTLDARESPASLDSKLAQFGEKAGAIKRIIFDPVSFQFFLFA